MSDVELRALERAVRQGEPVPDERLLAAWLRAHGDEEAKRTPLPGDALVRGFLAPMIPWALRGSQEPAVFRPVPA